MEKCSHVVCGDVAVLQHSLVAVRLDQTTPEVSHSLEVGSDGFDGDLIAVKALQMPLHLLERLILVPQENDVVPVVRRIGMNDDLCLSNEYGQITGQGSASKAGAEALGLLPILTPFLEFPALGFEPSALGERTPLGKSTRPRAR